MKWIMAFALPFLLLSGFLRAQLITLNPTQPVQPVNWWVQPGVFFVPKTQDGFNAYLNSGVRFGTVRLNVIESALNNATNLAQCLAYLELARPNVMATSQHCDRLVLIFEKMPAWLSSSSDGSPAQTPGWSVLNTKPPANWATWQTVVDSIVHKINNQWGLAPYYEVWNEPDIGSWTGTESDYFQLYRSTWSGAKAADAAALVGGPALNYWGNGLSHLAIPEALPYDTFLTHSLLVRLTDSALAAGMPPDFLSWHAFLLAPRDMEVAAQRVSVFLNSRGLTQCPLIVSEWNAVSAVRDSPIGAAYLPAVQLRNVQAVNGHPLWQAVAAWQDFNASAIEFHQDYGLLTYGSLHKPAWSMQQLLARSSNQQLPIITGPVVGMDLLATASADTLRVFLLNYTPPALVAAFEALIYGPVSLAQLDADGYIDLQNGTYARLDSALRQLLPVTGALASDAALLSTGIPMYHLFDSLATTTRLLTLNISFSSGVLPAQLFRVDSTHNNQQFRYDSLRAAGFTQANAISYLLPQQQLQSETVSFTNGMCSFSMQPNAAVLLEIPGLITGVQQRQDAVELVVFPNPAQEQVSLQCGEKIESWQVFAANGQEIDRGSGSSTQLRISTAAWPGGVYLLTVKTVSGSHQQRLTVRH